MLDRIRDVPPKSSKPEALLLDQAVGTRLILLAGGCLPFEIVSGRRAVVLGELRSAPPSPAGQLTPSSTCEVLGAVAHPDWLVFEQTPRKDRRWWILVGTRVNRTLTAWPRIWWTRDIWLRLHPDRGRSAVGAGAGPAHQHRLRPGDAGTAGPVAGGRVGVAAVNRRMLGMVPAGRRAVLAAAATIDIDATDVEVYGRRKRGVAYNYAGQRGGRPHVAIWAQTQTVLAADLLSGDQDPDPGWSTC